MSLEQFILDSTLADATVTALIGARMYLVQIPQKPTYPCLSYQRVGTAPLYTQNLGSAQGTVGWARVQFVIYGKTGAEVLQIKQALTDSLQTWNAGALPRSPQVHDQAPNFVLGGYMSVLPMPQQPIFTWIMDARIFYGEDNQ